MVPCGPSAKRISSWRLPLCPNSVVYSQAGARRSRLLKFAVARMIAISPATIASYRYWEREQRRAGCKEEADERGSPASSLEQEIQPGNDHPQVYDHCRGAVVYGQRAVGEPCEQPENNPGR